MSFSLKTNKLLTTHVELFNALQSNAIGVQVTFGNSQITRIYEQFSLARFVDRASQYVSIVKSTRCTSSI
jgi:hypothetical protein